MGRNAGFIALHAGVSGGADVIPIPAIPFKFEAVLAKVRERVERGMLFSIIAVSEGAKPLSGEQVFSRERVREMRFMYHVRAGSVIWWVRTLRSRALKRA